MRTRASVFKSANFNPRSPHGERPAAIVTLCNSEGISIHALLTESDEADAEAAIKDALFQSTLSSRRATVEASILRGGTVISIHALLTESDGVIIVVAGMIF